MYKDTAMRLYVEHYLHGTRYTEKQLIDDHTFSLIFESTID